MERIIYYNVNLNNLNALCAGIDVVSQFSRLQYLNLLEQDYVEPTADPRSVYDCSRHSIICTNEDVERLALLKDLKKLVITNTSSFVSLKI